MSITNFISIFKIHTENIETTIQSCTRIEGMIKVKMTNEMNLFQIWANICLVLYLANVLNL